MSWLGSLINWGTEQQPSVMGIVVSVLMGMILTLPISSAALGRDPESVGTGSRRGDCGMLLQYDRICSGQLSGK